MDTNNLLWVLGHKIRLQLTAQSVDGQARMPVLHKPPTLNGR
jgi:hypothetical protein